MSGILVKASNEDVVSVDETDKLVIDSLPDIGQIKMPEMKVVSTKIRWLSALGYSKSDIQKFLNVRYQQVRNVLTTIPKRAAREDLPPLVIELMDPIDDIQAIMDTALEQSLGEGRRARKKADSMTSAVEPVEPVEE